VPIVVQKYGGSSVADVERLSRVADKVAETRRAGFDVVVVVSAMGKTTDALLALAGQVAKNPPRRELDMLVSTGERVSMALLSMAMQERGLEAISFTGSQSGIITNDRHFDARIIEVRPVRIEDELARGRVVIVAGFQGVSYKKEITTLGRGGSDTTAVALAAALGAERCEIYSDVEGVFTADPRVVADARHLPEIGYEELQEMAQSGAKVLNAQAVEFAKRARIAIHARSTALPYPGSKETIVREVPRRAVSAVRAVASDQAIVRGRAAGGSPVLRRLVQAAASQEIALRDVSVGPADDALRFLVCLPNVPDWGRARAALGAAALGLELHEGLASVSLVGEGIGDDPRQQAAALDAVEGVGATQEGLWASGARVTVLVARERVDEVVRAAHTLVV
jgi:aspartate kinase